MLRSNIDAYPEGDMIEAQDVVFLSLAVGWGGAVRMAICGLRAGHVVTITVSGLG